MLKKISLLLIICFFVNNISAQTTASQTEPFYVNVFIDADKNIYVETEKVPLENVERKVSEIVRKRPFQIDQRIIYRIFADENLKHGYIMDVNQEMISAYGENVITQKYLLDTVELNIDGGNWFESIDID